MYTVLAVGLDSCIPGNISLTSLLYLTHDQPTKSKEIYIATASQWSCYKACVQVIRPTMYCIDISIVNLLAVRGQEHMMTSSLLPQ